MQYSLHEKGEREGESIGAMRKRGREKDRSER
jgi:hypothetical protein